MRNTNFTACCSLHIYGICDEHQMAASLYRSFERSKCFVLRSNRFLLTLHLNAGFSGFWENLLYPTRNLFLNVNTFFEIRVVSEPLRSWTPLDPPKVSLVVLSELVPKWKCNFIQSIITFRRSFCNKDAKN